MSTYTGTILNHYSITHAAADYNILLILRGEEGRGGERGGEERGKGLVCHVTEGVGWYIFQLCENR